MRMEVAAANKRYNQKVAAAKKIFEHKKAEAAKERDVAIAAAQWDERTVTASGLRGRRLTAIVYYVAASKNDSHSPRNVLPGAHASK